MQPLQSLIRFSILTLTLWFGIALQASAASPSQIYVFGDSLSDIGNLKAVTQNPQIPERFTNGPVAVEIVAAGLGLSLSPSLHLLPPEATGGQLGNNFAIASAVAIDEDGDETTPDINLPTQVNAFLQSKGGQAPSDALYVMMIGGNDIFAAQDIMINGTWGAFTDADRRIRQAVQSEKQQLLKLIGAGARNILVVNAGDVGAIPNTDIKAENVLAEADSFRDYLIGFFLEDISRSLSEIYNLRLDLAVADIESSTGVDLQEFDLIGFLDNLIENKEQFGYTNVTDACIFLQTQGGAPNPGCNFETWLFFDEIHPTAITHQRAGQAILQTLQ